MLNWIETQFGFIAQTTVGPIKLKKYNNPDAITVLKLLSGSGWNKVEEGMFEQLKEYANILFEPKTTPELILPVEEVPAEEPIKEFKIEGDPHRVYRDNRGVPFKKLETRFAKDIKQGDYINFANTVALVKRVNSKIYDSTTIITDIHPPLKMTSAYYAVDKVSPIRYHSLPNHNIRYHHKNNYLISSGKIKSPQELVEGDYVYLDKNLFKCRSKAKEAGQPNTVFYIELEMLKDGSKREYVIQNSFFECPQVYDMQAQGNAIASAWTVAFTQPVKNIQVDINVAHENKIKKFAKWQPQPNDDSKGMIVFQDGTMSDIMDADNLMPIMKKIY